MSACFDCDEDFLCPRCEATQAARRAPLTPSQMQLWKCHAYGYLMNHRLPNAEIVRRADADVFGIETTPLPRDIDARCQPEKACPERFLSDGSRR